MSYYVRKSHLSGKYHGIASKSVSHRILLLSTLLDEFTINNCLISNDTLETISFIRKLGFSVDINDNNIIVKKGNSIDKINIDLNESASTLRFIIPFSLLHLNELEIQISDKLKERFNDIYDKLFLGTSVKYSYKNNLIKVSGSLSGGIYQIPKTVSSQFVSSLLLTLPFVKGDSELIFDEIPSKPYIELTIDILNELGIEIKKTSQGYSIKGSQTISKKSFIVENDYSNAAFFIVANKLGSTIGINCLKENSKQGDKMVYDFLDKKEINLLNNPDLAPILFVYAALQKYSIKFTGLKNLIYKESNRLVNMLENLKLVNAKFSLNNDELIFYPSKLAGGVTVLSYNDHRIAMSMIILGSILDEGLFINEIKSINKSYPTFIEDFKSLGGIINVK